MGYGSLDLRDLQHDIGVWSRANFGDQPSTYALLGVMEEAGVLAHAHLKGLQGIRMTPEEVREKKEDAVADIVIYLLDYCEREGLLFEQALIDTKNKVLKRNWKDNPQTAAEGDLE